MSTLRRIAEFCKEYRTILIFYSAAALLAAASFAVGYLYAKQDPLPIIIEKCSEPYAE